MQFYYNIIFKMNCDIKKVNDNKFYGISENFGVNLKSIGKENDKLCHNFYCHLYKQKTKSPRSSCSSSLSTTIN